MTEYPYMVYYRPNIAIWGCIYLNIKIDDKAKEYIKSKSKDNAIRISLVTISSGWAVVYEPSVEMGKPYDETAYNLHRVEDIDVYIMSNLKPRKNTLRVKLNRFLWINRLNVEGLL